jgi:hypothetical protein
MNTKTKMQSEMPSFFCTGKTRCKRNSNNMENAWKNAEPWQRLKGSRIKVWGDHFQALHLWKGRNGYDYDPPRSCVVHRGEGKKPLNLGIWCKKQRQKYKNTHTGSYGNIGVLSTDQIERLESINFQWDLYAKVWEMNFTALVLWKEQHGFDKDPLKRCAVPQGVGRKPLNLGNWCNAQRKKYRNAKETPGEKKKYIGTLSAEQIKRLKSVGFGFGRFGRLIEKKKRALPQQPGQDEQPGQRRKIAV